MNKHRPRHGRAIFPASICLALANAPSASAGPTFVVNSFLDVAASANTGDGVCQRTPSNHVCTLRAAVQESYGAVDATIRVPPVLDVSAVAAQIDAVNLRFSGRARSTSIS